MTSRAGSVSRFRFRAVDATGRITRGVEAHDSEQALLADLRRRGLTALCLEPSPAHWHRQHRIRPDALATLLRTLADLLSAGLPPAHATSLLPELLPQGLRTAVSGIEESLRQGDTMTAALDRGVGGLPEDVRGVLEAGEISGSLSAALKSVATELEATESLKAQLRAALAYPALLVASTAALLLLLGTVFVPRLLALLGNGAKLPRLAMTVVWFSEQLRWLLPFGAALGACIGIAIAISRRHHSMQLLLAEWLLRLPFVGALRLDLGASRVGAVLSTALGAGLPAPAALALAGRSTSDRALAKRIARAQALLNEGRSLSQSFAATEALTPTLVRILKLGEATGSVAPLLARGAQIERQRIITGLQRALGVLQPTLLLLIGGVVGTVAVGMLQAVYSVRPN